MAVKGKKNPASGPRLRGRPPARYSIAACVGVPVCRCVSIRIFQLQVRAAARLATTAQGWCDCCEQQFRSDFACVVTCRARVRRSQRA